MKTTAVERNYPAKTRKLLLIINVLVCCSFLLPVRSQGQQFVRTTFSAPYVPISTGSGAVVSTATGDDVNQTGILLGFNFNYAGVNYSSVGINTNGLLWFDATAPTAAEGRTNQNMVSTNAPNNCISPWWNNMIDDASSEILYQTQGAAGNRTFTVQYTNYPSYTGVSGTNARMNCQVILYETSNIIELRYGSKNVLANITAANGAAIGLEYGPGGTGNFIDAISGSSGLCNRFLGIMSAWPTYNFRFTPGTPSPLPGGVYTVGVGQTYNSLTQATADINHRGISGSITLSLTDEQYDTTAANGSNIFPVVLGYVTGNNSVNRITIEKTGAPATIAYRGSAASSGFLDTYTSTATFSVSEEPILAMGTQYATLRNVKLMSHGTGTHSVDRGLLVFQSASLFGAKFNTFENITVDLDRTNTNSIGIAQERTTNPGGTVSTNANNTYRDLIIKDCYRGIVLTGVGGVYSRDAGNKILTSNCFSYNMIGDPDVPNDIGGSSSVCHGVGMANQRSFILRNTKVSNVTLAGASNQLEAISIQSASGVCEISNCQVKNIRRAATSIASGLFKVCGIRISHETNAIMRIFNNGIAGLYSNYSGAVTANRLVIGIYLDDASTAGNFEYNVWNNSVSVDGSSYPNCSNTCVEISNATVNDYNFKNNVFANYTTGQTGVARHYCFVTPSANSIGTASKTDYNDYYIQNGQGTTGFVGLGSTTEYSTVSAWSAGLTLTPSTDVHSFSANPFFVNKDFDLHASYQSVALNGSGTDLPSFFSTDVDCESRSVPQDIGMDDFQILSSMTLLDSVNPGTVDSLCGIAFDAGGSQLWVYACSANEIKRFSTSGSLLGQVSVSGGAAGKADVDLAPESFVLNATNVNSGQMLFTNGGAGTTKIYSYNAGAVTATLNTAYGNSHVVGSAYHRLRNSFFLLQGSDAGATEGNKVVEINAQTGAVIGSFKTTGYFNVVSGDIATGGNGNLFLAGSTEGSIAEFTTGGDFVRFHPLPAGVSQISGLGLNCNTGEAWMSSKNGNIYHVSGFPCGTNSMYLTIKVLVEGLYLSDGVMTSALVSGGLSSNESQSDSVSIDLRASASPYSIVHSFNSILRSDGLVQTSLPESLYGQSVYVVVKGRNIIETWSKIPMLLQQENYMDFNY